MGRFLAGSLAAHLVLLALLVPFRRSAPPPSPTHDPVGVALPVAVSGPAASVSAPASASASPSVAATPARRPPPPPPFEGDPFAIGGVSVPHGDGGRRPEAGGRRQWAGGKSVEGGVRSREGQGGSGEGRRAAVDVEAIRAAVQAAATYPRLARERGIEGTVVVRFAILADGSVGELAVVGPADEILGEAARAAVRRAAPFASPAGTVKLPVEFSLAAP